MVPGYGWSLTRDGWSDENSNRVRAAAISPTFGNAAVFLDGSEGSIFVRGSGSCVVDTSMGKIDASLEDERYGEGGGG